MPRRRCYDGLLEGQTKADITNGYGELSAVPIAENAAASEVPYPVKIARTGTSVELNGTTYENVFLSRDYTLTLKEGQLTVTPVDLSNGTAVLVEKPANVTYSGQAQKQSVTVKTAQATALYPRRWTRRPNRCRISPLRQRHRTQAKPLLTCPETPGITTRRTGP